MKKTFVIGYSGAGKTTFCNALCARMSFMRYVSAGAWAVERFAAATNRAVQLVDKRAERQQITKLASDVLAQDPDVATRAVNDALSRCSGTPFVIDSVRNPRDFVLLLNVATDTVVFVNSTNAVPVDAFETYGIAAIHEIVRFMLATQIMRPNQVRIVCPGGTSFDDAVELVCKNTVC